DGKNLKQLKDQALLDQVSAAIQDVKAADSITTIHNLLQLKGYQEFYRIRIGNYQIGLSVIDEAVIFVRSLSRKA
ncbi:MAG: type II toxin-antitoxin system RelE/ParE family toxin, partial [Cyanobacteria bacterium J06638_28]